MIMEYANGGEIIDMLREKGTLNEMDARRIILQITNSINYCHTRGIIHRDLKLENVLVQESGHIAISDFDLSLPFPPPVTNSLFQPTPVPPTTLTFECQAPIPEGG